VRELDAPQRIFRLGGLNMDDLKKTGYQDRSKINMHEPHEVQYWTKHLGVSKEQLQKAVDKVGNAAAAVKKELAA
jgi:3-oxoacyl-[acyl-carrier-protein] synthase III